MSKPVLLVEGNPDDERLALYALEKNGLGEEGVAVARDGAEALEYLFGARAGRGADGLPGLVILDQRLPGVDGPEVLRRLRTDDRTVSLPVVMLTAGDLSETPDDYGAWTFIQKPLTPEKFAEAAWKLGVRGPLPGEAVLREKQTVTSEPSQAVARGDRPLRVLLVEDSEDDAALILWALRHGGHEPVYQRVETRAGMEAALAEEEWDVLVSDYHLPAFGAMEALEIARESGLDLPFIVVSGKVGEDAAVEVMRSGAHDYVVKANLARLGPAVEREVREARGRRERRRAEAALHESEQRFRSLVRNSSDITVVLDARGTILYESPAVERVLGYAPEERTGRNIFDLVHPGDLGRVSDALARSLEEPGVRPPVEYRVRHKDGSWRHFEATGNNLLSDPTVKGIVVNTRDITEHKRAVEESNLLRAISLEVGKAEDLDSALRATLQGVCEATGWVIGQAWVPNADGTALECSPAWYTTADNLTEFRAMNEALVLEPGVGLPGHAWLAKRPAWTRDISQSNYLRAPLGEEFGLRAGVDIPVLADSEVVAVLDFFVFEQREEDERLVELVTSVAAQLGSVIRRKQAEEALRENEANLAEAQQIAHLGSWSVEPLKPGMPQEKREMRWSDEMYRIFGFAPREFTPTSESPIESVHPQDREYVRRALEGSKCA